MIQNKDGGCIARPRWFNAKRMFDLLFYLGLAIIIAMTVAIHTNLFQVELEWVMRGFSPIDFANSVLYADHFARDYPGGARNVSESIVMYLYPLADRYLGIPPEEMIYWMVTLGVLTFAVGIICFTRTLYPASPRYLLLVLLLVLFNSEIRRFNLANFGAPVFFGEYYAIADGLRLLAIAAVIKNRYWVAAVVMAVIFAAHPIKAVLAGLFIVGIQLVDWRRIREPRRWTAGLALLAFCAVWAWGWLGMFDSQIERIGDEDYVAWSRLFQYHWYPFDVGILGQTSHHYLPGFLALMLAGGSALGRAPLATLTRNQVLAGLGVLGIAATIGLTVSAWGLFPTLIKICLQRGTTLMMTIAVIALGVQMHRDLVARHWLSGLLGLAILMGGFFLAYPTPPIFAMAYLVVHLVERRAAAGGRMDRESWLLVSVLAVGGAYFLHTIQSGSEGYREAMVAHMGILIVIVAVAGLMHFTTCWRKRLSVPQELSRLLASPGALALSVLAIFGLGAVQWGRGEVYVVSPESVAVHYKEAQLWARENTDPTALFMTDPCQAYSWRDLSRRSSFGTLQEWLKSAWLYNHRRPRLEEGLERLGLLGVDPGKIKPHPNNGRHIKFAEICREMVWPSYYSRKGVVQRRIADAKGVDYFVLFKQRAKQYGAVPDLPVVYENQDIAIVTVPENDTLDKTQ